MTAAVKRLLKSFEQLSNSEQREVIRAILRRSMDEANGPFSDEALAQIADESFLELDRRELD